jgi:hypothetical protein
LTSARTSGTGSSPAAGAAGGGADARSGSDVVGPVGSVVPPPVDGGDPVVVPGPADDEVDPAVDVPGAVAPLKDGDRVGVAPVVPGAAAVSDAESDDGGSSDAAVVVNAWETVPDVVTPAKDAEVTGRPSRPITTGEFRGLRSADEEADESSSTAGDPRPTPETTGMARTSPTTVVVTSAPSAIRPSRADTVRRRTARRTSDQRVRAPETRAESGGLAGRWCTGDLTRSLITNRYRGETIGARKVTVSPQ